MAVENVELGISMTAEVDIDKIIKDFMGCVHDTTDEVVLKALADRSKPLPSLVEMMIKISYKVVGVAVEYAIKFLKPTVLMVKMTMIDVPIIAALAGTPLQPIKAPILLADMVSSVGGELLKVLKFITEFLANPFQYILDKLLAAVKNIKLPIPEIELFPGIKLPKIDNNNEQDGEVFKIQLDADLAKKLGLDVNCKFLDIFKKLPSMSVEDIAKLPPQFDFFLTGFKMLKGLVMMPVDMLKDFIMINPDKPDVPSLESLVKAALGLIPTDPLELLKLPLKVVDLIEKILEYLKGFVPTLPNIKEMVLSLVPLPTGIAGEPLTLLIKQNVKIVTECIPKLLMEIFENLLKTVFTELAKIFTEMQPPIPDFAAQKDKLKAADGEIKKLQENGLLSQRIYKFLELYAKDVEIPNSNPIEYTTVDAKSMKTCADLLKENKPLTIIDSLWIRGGYSPLDSVEGKTEHDDIVAKLKNIINPSSGINTVVTNQTQSQIL